MNRRSDRVGRRDALPPGFTPRTKAVSFGAPWWTVPKNRDFLACETRGIEERFPFLSLVSSEVRPNHLAWRGWFRTPEGNAYLVEIVYPDSYPFAHPSVYLVSETIDRGCHHVLSNGSLCVLPSVWQPYRNTAGTMVAATAAFLTLYDCYKRTGQKW